MPEPYLNIETKHDSAEQIAALMGIPSKFKYSAEEWNLIRDKINELHGIIQNTDLGTAAENNIKVKKLPVWIDWNAPGTTEQKVIAAINASNPFSVAATELVYFYCYKNQTMYQPQTPYNPEIHYWIFTLGKGDYGSGTTPITVNDKPLLYRGYTKENNETQTYNLGEIGQTPIAEHINNLPVSYTNNTDSYTIFDVKRNQEAISYLFLGTQYLIGNFENEPEAEEVFENQFRNLSAEPAAPTNPTDFLTSNELSKSLYAPAKYYITDVIANANISGSEDFALIETDTYYYFASKKTNEESFEGSSIKPLNAEGIRFELAAPDLVENGYYFWKIGNQNSVNYQMNDGFVYFQFWEKGGGTTTEIIDNLTSTAIDKALSANQGRVLKGFVDSINALLNSDDTTLDELQEIVDYIKQNKQELQNLSINNIAGLVDALANKTPTGGSTKTAQDLENLINNIQTFSGDYNDLTNKPGLSNFLKFVAQSITDTEKAQARENIKAAVKIENTTVTLTGGAYTLQASDVDKFLIIPAPATVIVPNGLAANLTFQGKQAGNGDVEFVAESGGTLNVCAAFQKFTEGEHAYWAIRTFGSNVADLLGTLRLAE